MSAAARTLQALRKTYAGGRPKKPTKCRCGVKCASAREAALHCRKPRAAKISEDFS